MAAPFASKRLLSRFYVLSSRKNYGLLASIKLFTCNLNPSSNIHTSQITHLKEIRRTEDGNHITIEGVKIKSDREGKVLKTPTDRGKCPLCRTGITHLKHTDILILSQFIESDGTVIPPFVTGLCRKQQFRVTRAVSLAQKAGLLPKKPGTPFFGDWEKYNTYFKRF